MKRSVKEWQGYLNSADKLSLDELIAFALLDIAANSYKAAENIEHINANRLARWDHAFQKVGAVAQPGAAITTRDLPALPERS